jgi:hypothetical protein
MLGPCQSGIENLHKIRKTIYNLMLFDTSLSSFRSIFWSFYCKAQAWHTISYINGRFFVVAVLLIKAKYQYGKTDNKNTGLFINCMDFVVVRTKINKKRYRHFFCYDWLLYCNIWYLPKPSIVKQQLTIILTNKKSLIIQYDQKKLNSTHWKSITKI